MPVATVRSPLTKAVLKALGLEGRKITKLSLHLNVDEVIKVDMTELVQDVDSEMLVPVEGRYTVEPIEG